MLLLWQTLLYLWETEEEVLQKCESEIDNGGYVPVFTEKVGW